jgi:ABC-2 type transport system ATP-binding protein
MLLLLDEPTTGLDPRSKMDVQNYVRHAMHGSDNDLTIIITTHDMREAEVLCDRVAVIIDGRFIALGSPAQLLAQYEKSHLDDVFLELTGREWKEVEDEY